MHFSERKRSTIRREPWPTPRCTAWRPLVPNAFKTVTNTFSKTHRAQSGKKCVGAPLDAVMCTPQYRNSPTCPCREVFIRWAGNAHLDPWARVTAHASSLRGAAQDPPCPLSGRRGSPPGDPSVTRRRGRLRGWSMTPRRTHEPRHRPNATASPVLDGAEMRSARRSRGRGRARARPRTGATACAVGAARTPPTGPVRGLPPSTTAQRPPGPAVACSLWSRGIARGSRPSLPPHAPTCDPRPSLSPTPLSMAALVPS